MEEEALRPNETTHGNKDSLADEQGLKSLDELTRKYEKLTQPGKLAAIKKP